MLQYLTIAEDASEKIGTNNKAMNKSLGGENNLFVQ